MINWKTILSSFDDKPTLMQWLKIVEKALQNAALESVTAKTAPNNAVAFEFKFADGSTVTSTAANLEAKGISGIEEVSDEVVGNQTLTTLRAHYTDGTMDEFPVYAQNAPPIYLHTMNVILDDLANTVCQLQILSKDSTKITNVIELQNFVTNNKAVLIGFNPNKITYQASLISDKVFVSVMTLESSPGIITGYVKTVLTDQVAMV